MISLYIGLQTSPVCRRYCYRIIPNMRKQFIFKMKPHTWLIGLNSLNIAPIPAFVIMLCHCAPVYHVDNCPSECEENSYWRIRIQFPQVRRMFGMVAYERGCSKLWHTKSDTILIWMFKISHTALTPKQNKMNCWSKSPIMSTSNSCPEIFRSTRFESPYVVPWSLRNTSRSKCQECQQCMAYKTF